MRHSRISTSCEASPMKDNAQSVAWLGGDMNGSHRRAIRAIAARMAQLEATGNEELTGVEKLEVVVTKSHNLKDIAFIGNIKEILEARELVKLKVLGKDMKRKHVKEASQALCDQIPGTVVAQCVGHTALLFKPSGKLISELLAEEIKQKSAE